VKSDTDRMLGVVLLVAYTVLSVVAAVLICACAHPPPLAPQPPAMSAVVADGSTYKLDTGDHLCTAWSAAPGFAVTAGHCCVGHAGDAMTLIATDGSMIAARPVLWEMSPGPEADACVLRAEGPLAPPLVFAARMPAPGTSDGYTGYPHGQHYIGHGEYVLGCGTTDEIQPGASGSPVFTSRGVYMIVVQLRVDAAGNVLPGGQGTPIKEVERLLDRVGAHYTTYGA
jgi:hypothetical protein